MADITIPKPQALQSLDPRDYEIRIVVAGSRGYMDRREFHEVLCAYLERFEGKNILFISGAAHTGADDLIIRWCKKYKFPCKEMPADWDTLGKRAGYVRNTEMAKLGTHLLEFYDGTSRGSAHMIEEAMKYGLMTKIIYVRIPEVEYAQPQGPRTVEPAKKPEVVKGLSEVDFDAMMTNNNPAKTEPVYEYEHFN